MPQAYFSKEEASRCSAYQVKIGVPLLLYRQLRVSGSASFPPSFLRLSVALASLRGMPVAVKMPFSSRWLARWLAGSLVVGDGVKRDANGQARHLCTESESERCALPPMQFRLVTLFTPSIPSAIGKTHVRPG